ncbi:MULTISPECIES: hypothetical protein [Bilophila]|uniref:hypothetical protein n=1 Tax=Bilophila TaxID=35832 RepID=UPI000223889C|nr:hypothetical protein [Bilophila sp. 4_1_30]EGW43373.1 hypothetical protein HMPREF0178_03729 [Bilophila sp. 4_1_30]
MLGKIPSWLWAVLVCVVIYGAGVWRGLDVVTEEYEAKIAAMNATRAEEERARAEAVAAAEKNARERLAAETARGEKLARELAAKTAELDAERASVNRRIRDVSEKARRDCAGLSLEWVRLYNEALGFGAGHSAGNEGSAPGGTHDAPGSAGAARAGVQPDALATPEDVLAHIRDYGLYCRRLEAGYRALTTLYNGDSNDRHPD